MPTQVTEAGALGEAPAGTGRMLIQLITPGVGSSGTYPAETLEAAAESRAFAAGTLMFADHPGDAERYDRPERSIRDVAGVLVEDARWDGTALVAEARTYSPWTEVLTQMHDAIGVSIRATAQIDEGGVVERIDRGISVDFVTQAGRGGAIRQVYESARIDAPLLVQETQPTAGQDEPALNERAPEDTSASVEAREAATEATEHQAPAAGADTSKPPNIDHRKEPTPMGQINVDEARYAGLEEKAGLVPALESENASLKQQLSEAREGRRQAEAGTRARDFARVLVTKGNPDLAEASVARIVQAALNAGPLPLAEGGRLNTDDFTSTVEEARTAEESYLAAISEASGAGRVRGVGQTTNTTESVSEADADEAIARAFGRKGA